MEVELDVFSGRENPRWRLDSRAAQEIIRIEADLRPSSTPAPTPPGLGYRGFLLGEGDVRQRAFHGVVQTAVGVLADPELHVERRLLASLPDEWASLRALLGPEIEGSDTA